MLEMRWIFVFVGGFFCGGGDKRPISSWHIEKSSVNTSSGALQVHYSQENGIEVSGKHCEIRRTENTDLTKASIVWVKNCCVCTVHLEIIMTPSHMMYVVFVALLELSLASGVISNVHKIKTRSYPHLSPNVSSVKVYP